MFRFLHAADLHLDSPLVGLEEKSGAPVERLRGATRSALTALVDHALEEEVAFVVLAGDLWDGDWKDYQSALFFTRQMSRLGRADIPVYVVLGNHDAASQLARHWHPPGNVHLFPGHRPETVTLESLGVCLHGQSFAARSVTQNLAREFPAARAGYFNLGVLHTSLDGRVGHDVYAPCSTDDLVARGYDYWALGHVHQHEVVARDPWIVFPGNLQGRHIRETGPKGCCRVTVEDARVTEMAFQELDVLRWQRCEVDAGAAPDAHAVLELLRSALTKALADAGGRLLALRAEISGSTDADRQLRADPQRWAAQAQALALEVEPDELWLERLVLHTRPASRPEDLAANDALAGLLRAAGDIGPDSPLLEPLWADLQTLRSKLPAELLAGADGYDPARPEAVAEAREGLEALLLARLLGAGEGA